MDAVKKRIIRKSAFLFLMLTVSALDAGHRDQLKTWPDTAKASPPHGDDAFCNVK